MLSVSPSLSQQNRSVSFSPEVDAKEEQRAIRKDRQKVMTLLLQSDVAFVIDKSRALELLEQAKAIIDERFSDDESLISNHLSRINHLKRYGYGV